MKSGIKKYNPVLKGDENAQSRMCHYVTSVTVWRFHDWSLLVSETTFGSPNSWVAGEALWHVLVISFDEPSTNKTATTFFHNC